MIPQIVYVLVANEKNLYLEELWVSLWSLRRFHPEALVRVLVDVDTNDYINKHKELLSLISEVIVVPTPKEYNAKQRSRQIKTTIRDVIEGDFIFIDTDTVVCKPLDSLIDSIELSKYSIWAVPDGHLPLKECLFPPTDQMRRIFNDDCSDSLYWFNSGVMYVADTPIAHDFYKAWNKNWEYSCFEKNNSQDQPALLKTNKEFDYIIGELPGIYNAQIALSLKYFADAAILHWWHMYFIENQNYSQYFSLEIYRKLKLEGTITDEIKELIINAKQSFVSPSMPVGEEHILFMFTPMAKTFIRIYKEGGPASWLMIKMAGWLETIHHFFKK